jgi:hypothetical protein
MAVYHNTKTHNMKNNNNIFIFLIALTLLLKRHKPKHQWFIQHPGDLNKIVRCTSFEQAMDKWFEGYNLPFLEIDGRREPFAVSNARVNAYYDRTGGAVLL